LFWVFR